MASQNSSLIFIGIRGNVLALDKGTGTEVWRAAVGGHGFVNVVVEGDYIYAAAQGEVVCLSPISGSIRWRNPLKGLGRGIVTIGTAEGQAAAFAEQIAQDEAAQAAAAS